MSINLVVVTGRLGKDPEIRSTSSGKSVTSFSLAVDEGYGDKKSTLWVYCEAWDKTAEAIGRLVTKGSRVTVQGSLREDSWTDNDGNKKSRTKIVAQKVDIIDFIDKEKNDDAPF
jgi:single-strand DNA-binding protein